MMGGTPGFGMGMGPTMMTPSTGMGMGNPYATQPGMVPMYPGYSVPAMQPGMPMMGYPSYNIGPPRP